MADDNIENWNGVEIDLASAKSFALGLVSGLQISTETNGKCFYVALDTLDFVDTLKADVDALKKFQWYNLVVVDTLHLNGNVLALTE